MSTSRTWSPWSHHHHHGNHLRSDHLQGVPVRLGDRHGNGVRQARAQLLLDHGQEATLAVAMVTEDDAGSTGNRIQDLMVGHLPWGGGDRGVLLGPQISPVS